LSLDLAEENPDILLVSSVDHLFVAVVLVVVVVGVVFLVDTDIHRRSHAYFLPSCWPWDWSNRNILRREYHYSGEYHPRTSQRFPPRRTRRIEVLLLLFPASPDMKILSIRTERSCCWTVVVVAVTMTVCRLVHPPTTRTTTVP
jgi:hypothetical protein